MTTTESLDMIQVLYGIRQMYMQVWETAEKRFSIGVPVQELFDWCKHEYAEKDTFLERVIEDFKQVHSAQSDLQQTCNQLATDCISRQAAIDVAKEELDNGTFYDIPSKIESLPPAQPKPDEWCTDCKEYDTEKHCCPRFNRVIRNALKDAQPEIIRCEECRHYRTCEIFGKKITLCKRREYDALSVEPDDFCSYAERKEQDDG